MPRGSEIEEIVGSSKAKSSNSRFFQTPGIQAAQNLMTSVAGVSNSSSSTTSVRRHSRVELYENDRKQQRKQAARFSLKKFFKMGLTNHPYGIHFPSSHSAETSPHTHKNENQVQFLDKEHEREIVEREMAKAKSRPEIIHPLDLQQKMMSSYVPLVAGPDYLNGGSAPTVLPAVELVKITPRSTISPSNNKFASTSSSSNKIQNSNSINYKSYNTNSGNHFEKNIYNGNSRTAGVNKAGVNKSIIARGKLESYSHNMSNSSSATAMSIMDNSSKNDSGHETSSIHTENSEASSSSSTMLSSTYGGSSTSTAGSSKGEERITFMNMNQNEEQLTQNTNLIFNESVGTTYCHSRSSSIETANSLSTSTAEPLHGSSGAYMMQTKTAHQMPYLSENVNSNLSHSSSTPPSSSNPKIDAYHHHHHHQSRHIQVRRCCVCGGWA